MITILKKIFTSFVIISFLNSAAFAQSIGNNALPTNPNVTSGSANISQNANKLTINQNTDKLITNWSSFNIGKDATVQFIQPSSTSSALNRVTSSDPSYIFGTLQANGKIILVNPNGVLFANGAKVDVGSIIASTLNMADKDYASDQLIFEKGNLAGTIQNDGTIRAFAGGTVALIGSQVTNNGKIKTKQGTTALLAGDKVTLTLNGNRLIKYTIDQGALNSLVENNNAIIAKEGVVILSAKGLNLLSKSVVNNTGTIEAKGFSQSGGKIYLDGDQTTNSGKLVASSKNNSGGLIQVTGDEVKLTSTASLDASGATGGGNILVGGSYQNSDPTVRQARRTTIEGGSILNASATKDGDGGTIAAWSDVNNPDSITSAQGTFLATGGLNSGNGGRIETSGHAIELDGINVSTFANNGKFGSWLLDPVDFTLNTSALATSISTALNSGDVTIDTRTTGSCSAGVSGCSFSGSAGNITLSANSGSIVNTISKTSGAATTLNLLAGNNIVVNNIIQGAGSGVTKLATVANKDTTSLSYTNHTGSTINVIVAMADGTSGGQLITSAFTVDGVSQTPVSQTGLAISNNAVPGTKAEGYSLADGKTISITVSQNFGCDTCLLSFLTAGSAVALNVTATTGASGAFSGTGNLSLHGGTLNITTDAAGSYSGTFSGSGSLTKAGSGALTLSGPNTYSGATTLSAGTLSLGVAQNSTTSGPMGTNGTINLSGGTLQYTASNTTDYSSRFAVDSSPLYKVDTNGQNVTWASALSPTTVANGVLTKTGTGTLTLTGTNTYTGGTTISAGTLQIGSGGTAGSVAGNITDNAALIFNRSDDITYASAISGTGTVTKSGSNTLTLTSGSNSYTGTTTISAGTLNISGTGSLASGSYSGNIVDNSNFIYSSSADQTLSGAISGTGTLTKNTSSSSTLTLSNANSYTGTTSINAGTLAISNGSALGGASSGQGTTVASGATLGISGGISVAEPITISGAGVSSGGAIKFTGTTNTSNTYSGAITLAATSTINSVVTSGQQTISSTINGTSANSEALTVTASGPLTLSGGSVGQTTSLSTFNASTTSGNLTLGENITTGDTTSSSIVLNAGSSASVGGSGSTSSGNIIISGSPVLTTGTGGTAKLFTGSISDSTGLTSFIGSASGKFRYNSDETTTNYTTALSSGNYAIYRQQPTLTITANNPAAITYGSSLPSFATTVSGYQNGDTLSQSISTPASVAIGGSTSTSENYIAGSHTLTPSGAASGLGYGLSYSNGSLTINQLALTGSIATGSSTYGSALGSAGVATLTNVVSGDLVTANTALTATVTIPSLANKSTSGNLKAGTYASAENISSLNSGNGNSDANNYTYSAITGSYTVNPLALNAAIGIGSSTYGSSVTPGTLSFSNLVGSDSVTGSSVSIVSPAYSTSNKLKAGTYKQSVTSSLAGTDSGNYTLTSGFTTATNNYTVGQLALTGSIASSGSTYGDNLLPGAVSFNNKVTNDLVTSTASVNTSTTSTADKPIAGTYTQTANTIDGTDSANYSFAGITSSSNYAIGKRALTISGITAANKEYDGGFSATVDPSGISKSGLITKDLVTVTSVTGAFTDKHAGSPKTVSLTTVYGGDDKDNYNITDQASATAAITAKTLTPTITNTSVTKEYDGTTATSITPTYSFSGFVSGDTNAILTYDTKLYNSKNVNDANKVTVSGLGINSITGTNSSLASDYSLSSSSKDVAATITTKTLTVSGITAANKDYDGTTAATVSTSGAVYSGKVTLDSVTVSATGTFASATVGTGKTVNLTSTYTGTDVTNYNITNQSTTTANITNPGETPPEEKKTTTTTNTTKAKCQLVDCNDVKTDKGEIVFVKKNTFSDDKVTVTPVSIRPDVETPTDRTGASLIKIIVLKPGAEPVVDKEYQVTIRGNDAILKENTDVVDKTITGPGKSVGSARFSIENDKGKILEYNMVVRESGLEIRPLSFEALQFADKNKATVAGAALIDVTNNLKLPVSGIKTIILDLIIDKVFEEAMFNPKGPNRNIFNVNYY